MLLRAATAHLLFEIQDQDSRLFSVLYQQGHILALVVLRAEAHLRDVGAVVREVVIAIWLLLFMAFGVGVDIGDVHVEL